MSSIDIILDSNEKIIWKEKPDKRPVILSALGGVPIASIFLGITIGIPLITGLPYDTFFVIFSIIFSVFAVIIYPIWKLRKIPNAEYILTNKRLIKKSGKTKKDVWFAKNEDIKELIVKRGIMDKIFGTGKIYPITPEHPYEPIPRVYGEPGECNKLITEYNIVTKNYDSMTQMEHYKQLRRHPCLEGLNEPYTVKKILTQAIFGDDFFTYQKS